ncbi:DUF4232 domain-containing protein [Streptomyces sp. NBC_00247]|uniref:DUF4232 domain-containing protein n=1 Tax=Streptomyces sp. NBC_00247 TaxID=2975689 RepID=UPI002E2C3538|nr:DUF4232 domain-containing protein [Streptomyces sp. NBC_00247]
MDSLPRTTTPPAVRSPAPGPRARTPRPGGLRRFGVVPVLAASIALAAAGCGGSDATEPAGASSSVAGGATPEAPIASGEPTAGGPSAPDTAPAPSGPSDPASPTATSAAGGASAVQRCAAETLTMGLSPADAGAGQVYYRLTFTNTSKETCTLTGYPGVSLIRRDGSAVGVPATHEGTAGTRTAIGPGGTAEVTLHTNNEGVSDSPCWGRPDYLKVYPPGSTRALTLRTADPRVCGDRFTTTAVSGG